jgi:hypothetical protein
MLCHIGNPLHKGNAGILIKPPAVSLPSGDMKNSYIRFGRRFTVLSIAQIRDELKAAFVVPTVARP